MEKVEQFLMVSRSALFSSFFVLQQNVSVCFRNHSPTHIRAALSHSHDHRNPHLCVQVSNAPTLSVVAAIIKMLQLIYFPLVMVQWPNGTNPIDTVVPVLAFATLLGDENSAPVYFGILGTTAAWYVYVRSVVILDYRSSHNSELLIYIFTHTCTHLSSVCLV